MAGNLKARIGDLRAGLAGLLISPVALACLPAFSLGVYWVFSETGLMATAVAFPLLYMMIGGANAKELSNALTQSALGGLMQRDGFSALSEKTFHHTRETGTLSAMFSIEIDDGQILASRYGRAAADEIVAQTGRRIVAVMRGKDAICQTSDYRFSVCLEPVRQLDLELCIQMAGRIQSALEEPISVDGTSLYITSCVGFCQSTRVINKNHKSWTDAASVALSEAQANGPCSIRAFSEEMRKRTENRAELLEEVAIALDKGQIQPWFQPQISTDTGLVTGFEALARWQHPKRGIIPPSEFLSAIEQAGMLERLAEVMMYHSLTALKAWDCAGYNVPQIGVNFAGPELNNPKLIEKIRWELDRFDLEPNRLAVEVLETVVASAPDDTITRNINGLSKLGCRIDLDDFGTGHASIASIRRFSVDRIKIDRSFVMKSDRDPEQQRMISAILTMAERLGVETLAEGVETVGEHALLAQLGCDHVQGFGIGKPMPFDQTLDWIAAHNAKLQDTPRIVGNRMQ
jgi:EAL domain-containing protein (putative c-di-GMP-specific phosphodiesterase class I)/GGDEF domain-containing protein